MEELTEEVEKVEQVETEQEDCSDYKITEEDIERDTKAVKATSRILKFGLIFIAVFGLITLALNISCFCLSVKEDYALNHYEVTKSSVGYLKYGCGENDCKYCNGKTSYSKTDFVYYETLTTIHATLNNPKIACNVVFWILVFLYVITLILNLSLRIKLHLDSREFNKI